MYLFTLSAAILVALTSGHIIPSYFAGHDAHNVQPMSAYMHQGQPVSYGGMEPVVHAVCGTSSYSCTGPQIITPSNSAAFSGSYSSVWLSGLGASASVSFSRPDGYWVGKANDGGCYAFGAYGGSGDSKLSLQSSSGAVLAWACK